MAAFCIGIEIGVNGIEKEGQCTHDGVLMLSHDAALKRTASLDRRNSDMSWPELFAVDVG